MRKGLSTAIRKPGIHAPAKVKTTGGAEQLAEALWAKIRRTIAAFLVMQWRAGALYGSSPDEAFYVKCDSQTNPGESIGAGQVVCEIGVAPVKPAEFVIFRVSHRIRRHASSLRWLPRGNAEKWDEPEDLADLTGGAYQVTSQLPDIPACYRPIGPAELTQPPKLAGYSFIRDGCRQDVYLALGRRKDRRAPGVGDDLSLRLQLAWVESS